MITVPLTRLLRKEVTFQWIDECQKRFKELKMTLTSASVLVTPSEGGGLMIYTDSSR